MSGVPKTPAANERLQMRDAAGGLIRDQQETDRGLSGGDERSEKLKERTAELAAANEALRTLVAQREHAEAAVRRSESKFRALLENAQDLISIIDPQGVIMYASASAAHILGYSADELIGKNGSSYIHPNDHAEVGANLQKILNEGSAYVRCEMRFRHRDGRWRLLESVGSMTPADSPVIGVVVNSRDITERKASEIGLKNHARLQEATAELGRRALSVSDDQEMFDAAAAIVAGALGTGLSSVNELLPGGRELLMRAGVGWPEGTVGAAIVKNWRAVRGMIGAEPLVIADLNADDGYANFCEAPGAAGPVSAASVLIRAGDGGEAFGTVCALSRTRREFSHEDVTFLQTVADLLSTVIGRHRHREALRFAEARYERIVANTPGMVYQFLLRNDGTMALPFASEGSREVYGMEPSVLMANPQLVLGSVHPEDQGALYRSLNQSAASLRAWHWEGRFVLPSGEKWVQGASRPQRLSNGDVLWDGIIMDVSERRRAQEALRAAKEEAERASNAKSEFLSRMSHELRTPLNAILGFGQLLEIEDLGTAHNQSVEYILGAGRRLLELVDEVLDLSRIETGRVSLDSQPVDLTATLEATLQIATTLAQQSEVRFIWPASSCACVALADPARLSQVLLNLVTNAVRHSPPGGAVRLACRHVPGGRVRVAITDRGPGLPESECAQLFTAFDQLGAALPGGHGVGLGLAISKRVMDAMGGVIGVRSRVGKGATFFIELPAASSPAPPRERPERRKLPPEPPRADQGARTMLHLAVDEADARLIEGLISRRPSINLTTAHDPHEGLETAARLRPHLIILDAEERSALRRLRHDSRTRSTPVILLDGVAADASPTLVCLPRPLDAARFLQTVDEMIERPPV